mgnify:CR=1 FL=1
MRLHASRSDILNGTIWKQILIFFFPILFGTFFQQLYNTVDTWVVGNYVSNEAFSAVGTVGPIVNMLIGFFIPIAVPITICVFNNRNTTIIKLNFTIIMLAI